MISRAEFEELLNQATSAGAQYKLYKIDLQKACVDMQKYGFEQCRKLMISELSCRNFYSTLGKQSDKEQALFIESVITAIKALEFEILKSTDEDLCEDEE